MSVITAAPTARTEVTIASKQPNHATFAERLLTWFEHNGRHDLPWQQHKTDTPDAYKVWISEVMLQQTQVKTVIPYFTRFMQSFPTVQALANASWEEVADHWAGLGYYARARNLHKGAKQLVAIIESTGHLPQTVTEWEQIAGVGRSTAGAIVAMGLHKYGVICDGNVKRVLTRWSAIEGDITKAATNKQLWALAEQLTPNHTEQQSIQQLINPQQINQQQVEQQLAQQPEQQSGYFAQAMMDMGATICHRTKPACITKLTTCPIQDDCQAFAQNKQTSFPVKAKKAAKPSKYSYVLLLTNKHKQLLWLQRPDNGIWGGLWCLPLKYSHKMQGKKILDNASDDSVYEKEMTNAEQIIDKLLPNRLLDINTALLTDANQAVPRQPIKHTLTHFHWYLSSIVIEVTDKELTTLNQQLTQADISFAWLTMAAATQQLALPKAMDKVSKITL